MADFLPQRGSYKDLKAYQISECIYDITYYFAHTFLNCGDRTVDQMIQAARSGKQNIAEGSAAATTSRETEIKLTNVAKASLQELKLDYEDFLRTRELTLWQISDPRTEQTRRVCMTHNDSAYYREAVKHRSAETVANIALVLLHQADYMLRKLLEVQRQSFLEKGGIREEMAAARKKYRGY